MQGSLELKSIAGTSVKTSGLFIGIEAYGEITFPYDAEFQARLDQKSYGNLFL